VFTTSGTYRFVFVTQLFYNGQPSHGGDRKIVEVTTSTLPKGTLGSVASLLALTNSCTTASFHNKGCLWFPPFVILCGWIFLHFIFY
jgi:hypothetical protein